MAFARGNAGQHLDHALAFFSRNRANRATRPVVSCHRCLQEVLSHDKPALHCA